MAKTATPAQLAEKFITVGTWGAKTQHLAHKSQDGPFTSYTLCYKKTNAMTATAVVATCKTCQQNSLDPNA